MNISSIKFIWFIISLVISTYLSYVAFNEPMKFVPFSDLLATIISILIGMSLAISAILSTRPKLSEVHYKNDEEKRRIEKIIKKDDANIQDGQFMLFWFYYISLLLAVVLKFQGIQSESVSQQIIDQNLFLKITSSSFVFISSLSLLWSATLPSLLKRINYQRLSLE